MVDPTLEDENNLPLYGFDDRTLCVACQAELDGYGAVFICDPCRARVAASYEKTDEVHLTELVEYKGVVFGIYED